MLPINPEQSAIYLLFLFFLPPLIAIVKQAGFSTQVNALIAQLVYVVVGIAAAALSGLDVTMENAIPLIATATVVGQAAYKVIWDNLGKNNEADPSVDEQITAATSVVK
jgi:hypothetical protein